MDIMDEMASKPSIWKNRHFFLCAITSILLLLIGTVGMISTNVGKVTLEGVMSAIFSIGIISTGVLAIYWSIFYDNKSGTRI